MTEDEVIERLRQAVRQAGSLRALADAHDLTASYIHDVLNKRRSVSERVAAIVGVKIVRSVEFEDSAQ